MMIYSALFYLMVYSIIPIFYETFKKCFDLMIVENMAQLFFIIINGNHKVAIEQYTGKDEIFIQIIIIHLAIVVIHVVCFIIIKCFEKKNNDKKRGSLNSIILVDFIQFYICLTNQSLKYVLYSKNSYYLMAIIIFVVFMLFILPIIIFVFLWRNKNKVKVIQYLKILGYSDVAFPTKYKEFSNKYNILFSMVSLKCWYWKVVEVIIFNGIILVACFCENEMYKFGIILLIFSIYTISIVIKLSYYDIGIKEKLQNKLKFDRIYSFALLDCKAAHKEMDGSNIIRKWMKKQRDNQLNFDFTVFIFT